MDLFLLFLAALLSPSWAMQSIYCFSRSLTDKPKWLHRPEPPVPRDD